MRIDLYELYQDALTETNPEQQGSLTFDLFNKLALKAQRWLHDDLTGQRNQYMPGFPRAITGGFPGTQKINDLLRPFIKKKVAYITNGTIPYPDDYSYIVDIRIAYDSGNIYNQCACKDKLKDDPTVNEEEEMQKELDRKFHLPVMKQLQLLDSNKVSFRMKTRIPGLNPSQNRPICEQIDSGFQTYPGDVSSAIVVYIKQVEDTFLASIYDSDVDAEVYDPNNTIHPLFNKEAQPRLSSKIAEYFSMWVRDPNSLGQLMQINKSV